MRKPREAQFMLALTLPGVSLVRPALLALICAMAFIFVQTSSAQETCQAQRRVSAAADTAYQAARDEQQKACGDRRLCTYDCGILETVCKKYAKSDEFACIDECNLLSGRYKRQCKKECRANKRVAKAGCRRALRQCKDDCDPQSRDLACQAAQGRTREAAIKASDAYLALYDCEHAAGNEDAR